MNRHQAITHARKLCQHIKALDSESDDWKAIHALLVLQAQAEDLLNRCADPIHAWQSGCAEEVRQAIDWKRKDYDEDVIAAIIQRYAETYSVQRKESVLSAYADLRIENAKNRGERDSLAEKLKTARNEALEECAVAANSWGVSCNNEHESQHFYCLRDTFRALKSKGE